MNVSQDQHDPQAFLVNAFTNSSQACRGDQITKRCKIPTSSRCLSLQTTSEGLDKWNEPTVISKTKPLLTADKIPGSLDRGFQHMLETLHERVQQRKKRMNSGWHHTILTPHCTVPTDPWRLLFPTPKRSAKQLKGLRQHQKQRRQLFTMGSTFGTLSRTRPHQSTQQIPDRRWTVCWDGIQEPTPIKHIDLVKKQNPKLAMNVFGWDKGVHSEYPSLSHPS